MIRDTLIALPQGPTAPTTSNARMCVLAQASASACLRPSRSHLAVMVAHVPAAFTRVSMQPSRAHVCILP